MLAADCFESNKSSAAGCLILKGAFVARYREKILPLTPAVLLLVFAFLNIFAPWSIGERELLWREGYAVVQSQGVEYTPLPLVTVHGEAVPNTKVLFPMLAQGLSALGCPPEISCRVLSLTGLLGLMIVVFAVTCRTSNSAAAGACAAAMMISSVLVIDKVPDGFSNSLSALLLLGGHLLWYYFAALHGDWSKAWLIGGVVCAVGFYLSGIAAVIFFLFPLIFMRRPLGIFRHLSNRGMIFGIFLVVLAWLLWYLPYHFENVQKAQVYPQVDFLDISEYLGHLLTFPLDLGLRLLPWAMLAWAPFCVAFQTLDETPMFSRFLRTIFLVNFFLLWILPLEEEHDWIMLVPPLAIMTGLNYALAVRRYGNFYRKLSNVFAGILLPVSGVVLLAAFLIPAEMLNEIPELARPLDFTDDFGRVVLGCASGGLLLILALIWWQLKEKLPVWCCWLLIILAPAMVYNNLVAPYQALERPRNDRADVFRMALEQDGAKSGTQLYKYNVNDLFSESVYMRYPIKKIMQLSSLPKAEEPVVYVLSASFPDLPERSWRSLLPQQSGGGRRGQCNIWRGEWQGIEQAERKKPLLLEEILKNPNPEKN